MSPSLAAARPGMPCTTSWLSEAQTVAGIAAIALECGLGAGVADQSLGFGVDRRRRRAWLHQEAQRLEHPRHQLVGGPHLLELRRRLADNHGLRVHRRDRRPRPPAPASSPARRAPGGDRGRRQVAVDPEERGASVVVVPRAARSPPGTPSGAAGRPRRSRRRALTYIPPHRAQRMPSGSPGSALRPQRQQMRRDWRRRTSSSNGTSISRIVRWSGFTADHRVERARLRRRAREAVEDVALLASSSASRSWTISTIVESPTRLPGFDAALDLPAERVPWATASRRMSPVEIFDQPIVARHQLRLRALAGARRAQQDDAQRRLRRRCVSMLQPSSAAPAPDARLLHEAVVVPHDQLRLDLLDGVHRDADHDQDRGAAEGELQAEALGEELRQSALQRLADERDALQPDAARTG